MTWFCDFDNRKLRSQRKQDVPPQKEDASRFSHTELTRLLNRGHYPSGEISMENGSAKAQKLSEKQVAKVRYDGSACVNVRSVASVCKLLAGNGGAAGPLTWRDVSGVLWFVETCVTSKNLFFDGTVPAETAAEALDAVEQLKHGRELKRFAVSSITIDDPKDKLQAARDAMAEAKPLLDHFAFDPNIDRPIEQKEHEGFFRRLNQVIGLPASQRETLAQGWIYDNFRGSKCLAALIENGDEMLAVAKRIYQQHAGQETLVTAALINRFRLNYVNQLAATKQSAYVPDPGFETVTKQSILLFKDYLVEQMVKQVKVGKAEPNIIVENMKSEDPLPSIGLYALMATKAVNRPSAILETALNEFRQDTALMKLIWNNTRGGIALRKDSTPDEFLPEIDQHFYDNYKALEKQAADIKTLQGRTRRARSYLIPAVLKGLVKAIPEALGFGKIWDVVYTVLRETTAEASIPFLSDKLQGSDCDSYISQYKSLKWDFENDLAVQVPFSRLSEQIVRVFGRPIAGGPHT
jgi:hypothetical protein